MVLINQVYTKSGDHGKTVFFKSCFLKCNVLICTIGDIDEANSFCGQSAYLSKVINPYISKLLKVIQNNLFDLGADLVHSCLKSSFVINKRLKIQVSQVKFLEKEIDNFNRYLCSLRSFVLPGGGQLAVSIHIVRSIIRRVERSVSFCILQKSIISLEFLHYLNRLSDLLFIIARVSNSFGNHDVLWEPQKYIDIC